MHVKQLAKVCPAFWRVFKEESVFGKQWRDSSERNGAKIVGGNRVRL